MAPHMPNHSTRIRQVVNFMPQLLYPRTKSRKYPIERRMGGAQRKFGCGAKGKISTLAGIKCNLPSP